MQNLPSMLRDRVMSGKKIAAVSALAVSAVLVGLPTAWSATQYWSGNTNTNWGTGTNWSDANGNVTNVPASGDAITVKTNGENPLIITTGDTITTGRVDTYGPTTVTIEGGTLNLNGRWRIGGTTSEGRAVVNFTGGTINVGSNNDYGFTLGAQQVMTLNISGTAKMVNPQIFNLHGGASTTEASTINMSGGSLFLTNNRFIVGEGGSAVMNLTGGIVSTAFLQMGRNESDSLNGNVAYRNPNGFLNIGTEDGTGSGQIYIYDTANIGTKQAQATGSGTINLNSGIFSVRNLNLTDGRSTLNLNGGTFLAQKVTGNVTNTGSTVEVSQNFDASQSAIEGLAEDQTFYSAKQKGTVGTTTVSGTYAQTGGTLVLDYAGTDSFDKLTAANFNITGGTLHINDSGTMPTKETIVGFFGDSPTGTIHFDSVTATKNTRAWSVDNNVVSYRVKEDFHWLGGTSTDWSDKSNWKANASQFLPDQMDTVYIGTRHDADYKGKAVIGDGDSARWDLAYINGGQLDITGGTLETSNRLRVGNETSGIVNFSGGKWIASTTAAGVMLSAAKGDAYYSELNISGDALFENKGVFGIHGYSRGTINQSGGTVFNASGAMVQFGEGEYEAVYNLSGGTLYNVARTNVGTNNNYDAASGNGKMNVSGTGELYGGNEMRLGKDGKGYGELNLSGGLVSVPDIGANNGVINFTGGTLIAQTVRKTDLSNAGGTIEIAANFLTQARYDALAEGENYFEKYQKGSIGTMSISGGKFTQTAGTIVLDIKSDTEFDKLTARDGVEITGGTLQVNAPAKLPSKETVYAVFGDTANTLEFENITADKGTWKIENNIFAYRAKEDFTWTGGTSSDWSTKANWKDNASQFLPDTMDTVNIGTYHSSDYKQKAVIADGDNAEWNLAYVNGGTLDITGGTLYTKNRLRLGNQASGTVNFSGGHWTAEMNSGDGGIMIGAAKGDSFYSEMNISGTAHFQNAGWFGIHGYHPAAINQTGGTVFNSAGTKVQFGEGAYEAAYNLSGGTLYSITDVNVGTNFGTEGDGKGSMNVSGTGELYGADKLRLGNEKGNNANNGYGNLNMTGGLVSVPTIVQNKGSISLTGGTLVTQQITRGGLTNKGGTIEIAANYLTQERYDSLLDGENYFEMLQDGTIGQLTVDGVYAQESGRLIIDIDLNNSGEYIFDVLTADSFNITGGELFLDILELPDPNTSFDIFQIAEGEDWGQFVFDRISSSAEGPQAWILNDGILTFTIPDQVPEPSAFVLLVLGAGLLAGIYRKNKKD